MGNGGCDGEFVLKCSNRAKESVDANGDRQGNFGAQNIETMEDPSFFTLSDRYARPRPR